MPIQLNGTTICFDVPIGAIMMGPVTRMDGYLLCNGQAVSRTTYSALFEAIGINFGDGDGSTTFNVPDYRGCFLRGYLAGTTNDMFTKQPMGAPNINGTFSASSYLEGDASGAFSVTSTSRDAPNSNNNGGFLFSFDASKSNSVYGSASEIRPVNFAVNYFIKY